MIAASDLLNPAQLAEVRKRSDWKGTSLVIHAWALIFGAMALFVFWPNPITYILAVCIIGTRMLGLAILMHDGAHGVLTENQKLNMFLSQWFCAIPLLADTNAYRAYHLQHHANTQTEKDPDLILSAPFPVTKKSFRRKMIRDLTGQTAYQQRKAQFQNALGSSDLPLSQRLNNLRQKLGKGILVNLILLAGLAATGHAYLYFILWVVPFMTWQMAIIRIRNIAEHAMVPDNEDPFRNARTTLTTPFTRFLMAPYGVNYHVEHHLLMWVPCYNLPKTRKYLLANGFGDRMESKPNYRAVIKLATSRPDDEDKRGKLVHNSRRKRVAGTFGEGYKASNN